MRASNTALIIIAFAVIAFGFFVSHRVSVLAETVEYQKATTQAALTGQSISSFQSKSSVKK